MINFFELPTFSTDSLFIGKGDAMTSVLIAKSENELDEEEFVERQSIKA